MGELPAWPASTMIAFRMRLDCTDTEN